MIARLLRDWRRPDPACREAVAAERAASEQRREAIDLTRRVTDLYASRAVATRCQPA